MRTAIAAAVAAVVVLLGLNPAVADSAATWTVTPGGGFYTAHQDTDFSFLTDTTTGAKFQCRDGMWISGKLQSGSGIISGIAGTIAPQTPSSTPCSAVFDGSAQGAGDGQAGFKYLNFGQMHILSTGNLHFYDVSGCGQHINSGDAMIYTPSFSMAAGGSHDTNVITSP